MGGVGGNAAAAASGAPSPPLPPGRAHVHALSAWGTAAPGAAPNTHRTTTPITANVCQASSQVRGYTWVQLK